jgi:hypothetical protein
VAHVWRAQCGPRWVGTGPPSRADDSRIRKSACLVKIRIDSNGRLSGRCRCSGSSWMATTLVRAGVRASISILKLLHVSQSKLVGGNVVVRIAPVLNELERRTPSEVGRYDGEGVMDDPRRGGGEPTGVPGGAGVLPTELEKVRRVSVLERCARSRPNSIERRSIPPLFETESRTRECFRISIGSNPIDLEGLTRLDFVQDSVRARP